MKLVRVLEGIVPRSISGFTFQASRVVEEGVSGSVAAIERPGFWKLLDHKEAGDVLIVTKLARLNVWLLAAFCLSRWAENCQNLPVVTDQLRRETQVT